MPDTCRVALALLGLSMPAPIASPAEGVDRSAVFFRCGVYPVGVKCCILQYVDLVHSWPKSLNLVTGTYFFRRCIVWHGALVSRCRRKSIIFPCVSYRSLVTVISMFVAARTSIISTPPPSIRYWQMSSRHLLILNRTVLIVPHHLAWSNLCL